MEAEWLWWLAPVWVLTGYHLTRMTVTSMIRQRRKKRKVLCAATPYPRSRESRRLVQAAR